MRAPVIAVDFDGTLVIHRYPDIGEEVPDAVYWCKRWVDAGARLILYTIRDGFHLEAAVEWCQDRGIELWGENENPDQASWSQSRKVYAHVYVDDAAACAPLISPPAPSEWPMPPKPGDWTIEPRPHLDWSKVGPAVLDFIDEVV